MRLLFCGRHGGYDDHGDHDGYVGGGQMDMIDMKVGLTLALMRATTAPMGMQDMVEAARIRPVQ